MSQKFLKSWSTLLDTLESKLKIDTRYLFKGGVWAMIGQIVVTLSAFALSVIAARYIPKDAYGDYKYVLAVVAVISSISLTGLGSAVFQSTASGFDSALSEGFKANLYWSVVVFLLSICGGGYYLLAGRFAIGFGILLGGCITPFMTSGNLSISYLNGKKDFRRVALYSDIIGTALPAFAMIIVALFYPHPFALIATYFISNTVVVFYGYWRTVRIYHPEKGTSDSGIISYAKHLSIMGILSGVAGNIDQILLFHYTNAANVAIYNFATGILDQTKGPLKSLDTMMQARFAGRSDESITAGLRQKQYLILGVTLLIIAIYIPLAPFIYALLFPAYIVAVPYSQVYALSMLSSFLAPLGSHLAAKKKIRAQYINTLANSVLMIVVMVAGVIGWGLWGLIVARIITRIGGNFVTYIVYYTVSE